jgi:hypothetical protein
LRRPVSLPSPDHQHAFVLLSATKPRRKTVINKAKLILIAAGIAASSIAVPAAALAQSAYTTGSAASRIAAGYPSPYGYGGSGLYAYAPGYVHDRPTHRR